MGKGEEGGKVHVRVEYNLTAIFLGLRTPWIFDVDVNFSLS